MTTLSFVEKLNSWNVVPEPFEDSFDLAAYPDNLDSLLGEDGTVTDPALNELYEWLDDLGLGFSSDFVPEVTGPNDEVAVWYEPEGEWR